MSNISIRQVAVPLGGATIAVGGLLVWLLSGTAAERVKPALAQPAWSPPISEAMPRVGSPANIRKDVTLSPSQAVEKAIALIHVNLGKWLEAKRNGKEEDADQLLEEAQSLLTDENAAWVIHSLSPEELQTRFGMAAIRHWMNADPLVASNWIASRPDTTEDETLAVVQGWQSNQANLGAYIDQLPDTAWKQSFLKQSSSELAATDPVSAIKLAERMDPGKDQLDLINSLVAEWINVDPTKASTWIESIDDPALKEPIIASAARSYALTNPALAASWLGSPVKSEGVLKDAALSIAQNWVTQDPVAAANWVSQFSEGDLKTAAVDIVSKYWLQKDPDAANAWIRNLAAASAQRQ